MKHILLISLFVASCLAINLSLGGEPKYRVAISTDSASSLSTELKAQSYDVLKSYEHSVEAILSEQDYQNLKTQFNIKIIEVAAPLSKKMPTGYRNLTQINQILMETNKKYSDFTKVVDIAKKYGPGKTYEGRPIYSIRISGKKNAKPKKKQSVLILSAHHCREIVTPEIALYAIKMLTEGYNKDPVVTKLVDTYNIWIVPILNVDGLEYAWKTNNMWRKNRKPNQGGSYGVDLNRNYDLDWYKCGGSTVPSSQTYKGTAPFSEAESHTIRDFSRAEHFAKVIDFHSYGREVLHAYHRCTFMPTVPKNYQISEASKLAAKSRYRLRYPSGNGQHQSWQMKEITLYSYLVETHRTFQPSYQSAMDEVKIVYPLLIEFLSKEIPLSGRVLDNDTKEPLKANIKIVGFDWRANETRVSHSKNGEYHLFLPESTTEYKLEFSKPGYKTESVAIKIQGSVKKDILLRK
eukprot:gene683-8935_t